MKVQPQIHAYLASHPEPKSSEMWTLHRMIRRVMPRCRLWFLDGKDANNKTVSNPSIGYGVCQLNNSAAKPREFYRVGLSANTSGLSLYVMGLADKAFLPRACGTKIGKAKVSAYCIRFRSLRDIDIDVLEGVIRDAIAASKGALGTSRS